MNNKLYALIIILLLVVIGFLIFSGDFSNGSTTFVVGDTNFTLPDGYSIKGLNDLGDLILISDDGKNPIYIAKYNNKGTVKGIMKDYVSGREQLNESISVSNLTINGIEMYKSTNEKNGANHFWFGSKGDVYSIYTWNKNKDIDNIVIQLLSNSNYS